MRWRWLVLVLALVLPALAQGGPAHIDPAGSALTAEGKDRGQPRPLDLRLALSHPVPYRVYFLDGPPRLIVDFREIDFSGTPAKALPGSDLVPGLRWGRARPGWSRLVMELPGPYALRTVIQKPAADNGSGAVLSLRIEPVSQADFLTRGTALSALRDLPEPAQVGPAVPRRAEDGRLRIALDPGHGGHDPGAEVGAIRESAVMLGYARELAEVLTRKGFEVVMTRADERFVALEQRMTLARSAGAALFISLHADALPAGEAAGLSIYYWNQASDDRAARELAVRHDRADLVAGIDLTGTDDEVASVLMDLARQETQPRSETFAKFLVSALNRSGVAMHGRPVKGAAFSVLKSPDIPSVLIELGFLTDAQDRANLFDPEWRRHSARAIAEAITQWARDDAIRAGLARQ